MNGVFRKSGKSNQVSCIFFPPASNTYVPQGHYGQKITNSLILSSITHHSSLFTSFLCYNQFRYCENGREIWILKQFYLKNGEILRL